MVNWSPKDNFACNNFDPLLLISILKQHARPKTPKILRIIPVGSVEVERSIFIRLIHNWLRNSMPTRLLGGLAVNIMHGYTILILKKDISNTYMSIHLHRMIFHFLLMFDMWNICMFYRLLSLWYWDLFLQNLTRRQWHVVFIVNFEHISHLVLVFLLLTLRR